MKKPLDHWLSTVLRSIADGVIATDVEARILFMNRMAEELTGWNEAEAIGRPVAEVLELTDERTGQRESWPIAEALASGKPAYVPETTILVSRSGRRLHINDAASPIRDAEGAIAGAVIVFRDVTPKRRADDAVHESELRFRTLVNASSDVMFRMSPDWSEMQPLDGRDLVSSNTGPIKDWMQKNVPVSEHARVRDAIHNAVSCKETFELEHQVVRPDGTLGWTFSRAIPILDAHGEIAEWLGTASDITERKRDVERLQKSEERFRAAVQAVSGILWTNTAAGEMEGEQPGWAALTGQTFDEYQGFGWSKAVHPEDVQPTVNAWNEAVRERKTFIFEHRIRCHNGEWRSFAVRAIPVFGGDGKVSEWVGVHTDITEQQKAEAALRENDRRKDEFLAMLAHELRNPLAAVGNAATVLKMSSDPGNITFAKDIIERQTRQLARLIDDLLDVSRITSGKIRLRREVCDAGPILKQAIESVEPFIKERKHKFITDFEEGTLPFRVDPTRIEQIVINLLTNSAKYTESGGEIRLSAERVDDQIVISVNDNGIGIPPEKLPQMFELFAQGERSIARSEGGLGIGLTIVQKLAEMHGGSVSAESKGSGQGSTFTVRLPASPRPASMQRRPDTVAKSDKRGSRILVVDDNEDTAQGFARLLKLLGNDVQIAHDGPSAIEAARKLKPEFILLDIGLPGMDGYEVAQHLRHEPVCKTSVIIAVSGYGQDEDRRRSHEAGFDHHLVKPVDFDSLMSLLTQAI